MAHRVLAAVLVLVVATGCSVTVAALSKGPCSAKPAAADLGFAIGAGITAAVAGYIGWGIDTPNASEIEQKLERALKVLAVSNAVAAVGFGASSVYGFEHDSCGP